MVMRDPRGTQRPKCPLCGTRLRFNRVSKFWSCRNGWCKLSPLWPRRRLLPTLGEIIDQNSSGFDVSHIKVKPFWKGRF